MKSSASNPGRILIVDDDRDARDILTRLLQREGYQCVAVEDGPGCLSAARTENIDVILLDVMMPGMDGLQVCEELQKDEQLRAIPVILLTAKDDLATRADGMARGVSEYLTKPINKRELLGRVQAQLHSRLLDRQLEQTAAAIESPTKS
jgi:DNA-binding response OmpR family regulator